MVDDHSRYVLCLKACANEQRLTVQDHLTATFRRYGLPDAFYTDNGSPWGDTSGIHWTGLKVWLLKLGVRVVHARPRHPQARGKNERFHRTLKDEVFAMRRFRNLPEVQQALDAWRIVYNLERPHEALGMDVPASRYRPSSRAMPDRLPRIEYDSGEIVRTVSSTGIISPSRDECGKSRRPSRASGSPSGRSRAKACTEYSLPAGRSHRST